IGAVSVELLELGGTFQTLVAPGVLLPRAISLLTGLRDEELSRAPRVELAVRRFLTFGGEATLVAHNARFDVSFLNRQLERLTGRSRSSTSDALDTCGIACARTSAPSASAPPSRPRSPRSSGSNGGCSDRNSRPRSRSCA